MFKKLMWKYLRNKYWKMDKDGKFNNPTIRGSYSNLFNSNLEHMSKNDQILENFNNMPFYDRYLYKYLFKHGKKVTSTENEKEFVEYGRFNKDSMGYLHAKKTKKLD